MPWSRPTLTALRQQAAGDINTNLAGADGLLRRANLRVIGEILAGLANLHYGYEDWIAQQSVPFTSTEEFLEGWAALKGVIRKPATTANGAVTFPGANGGPFIPSGTLIQRGDGATFLTTADAFVTSNSVTALATATVPGAAGNTDVDTAMTLAEAITGVNSNGIVSTVFTGGADVETDTAFRGRMLEVYASPPQGGDQQDYITWALQVPGVTRAWCNPHGMGSGTVVVYTMWDVSEAVHNGFPQGDDGVSQNETRGDVATGDQLIVANYIFPLQAVTALVYSVAPIAAPQNFTIANLSPNTSAIKTSISAAVADLFLRNGDPVGASGTGGTIRYADIYSAIDAIPGILDFVITSPTTDISPGTGFLPTVGSINYV